MPWTRELSITIVGGLIRLEERGTKPARLVQNQKYPTALSHTWNSNLDLTIIESNLPLYVSSLSKICLFLWSNGGSWIHLFSPILVSYFLVFTIRPNFDRIFGNRVPKGRFSPDKVLHPVVCDRVAECQIPWATKVRLLNAVLDGNRKKVRFEKYSGAT